MVRGPGLWLPVIATATAVSPEKFPLRVVAVPSSPSTPDTGPLEAPLVDAGYGTPADFLKLGRSAAGAIALVTTEEMTSIELLFAEYMRDREMLAAAASARVAGLLLMSTRPRGLLYRHPVTLDGSVAPFAVAMASREHAQRLSRLLEKSEVTVRLELKTRTGSAYASRNVVAEIKGREKPGEIVLVGAHLDSWDLGTGAQDNGVNCVALIELARGINELGLTPRRTIRFVLFTGEEAGMWGSAGYVQTHAAELDDHVAAVIIDIGSGRITGFYLNGREELQPHVERLLAPVEHLGPFTHHDAAIDGTDNFDFMLSGVPNLVAAQETAPYLPDYHAESDVLEHVDVEQAKKNAAIIAAFVWGLAETAERIGDRQSREDVEALIESAGLESRMKALGQWDDWNSGRRGVNRRKD